MALSFTNNGLLNNSVFTTLPADKFGKDAAPDSPKLGIITPAIKHDNFMRHKQPLDV
jgi:hypothetical protein